MSDSPDALATPEQARANRRLGILLGLLVVAVVVTFICVFTRGGLPKDPGVWRRLQLEQSGDETPSKDPVGAAPTTPNLAPAQEPSP
jgi:hypothetical protein